MGRLQLHFAATFLALIATGCFSPHLPQQVTCGESHECPPQFRCETALEVCVPDAQAAVTALRFVTAPKTAEALAATTSVAVELVDASGRRVPVDGGSLSLEANDNPAGVELVTATLGTAAGGLVQFGPLTFDKPGRRVGLMVRAGDLTVTSATFDVSPTPPSLVLPANIDVLSGCATIPYVLTQAQSLPVDLKVEVDPDGPTGPEPYRRATQAASAPGLAGVLGIPGTPTGAKRVFTWNTSLDLPGRDTVGELRITPLLGGVASVPAVRMVTVQNGLQYFSFDANDTPMDATDIDLDGWTDMLSVDEDHGIITLPTVNLAVPAHEPTNDITTGDFDGNRLPDLVVATASATLVSYQRRQRSDRFAPVITATGIPTLRTIVAADFDRDGIDELAGVEAATGAVIVLRANPAIPGQFVESARPWTESDSGELLVGDLDHDGWLDLVIGRKSTGGQVVIVRGTAAGWLPASTDIGLTGNVLAVGDLDHDGRDDVAALDSQGLRVAAAGALVQVPGVTGDVIRLADVDGDRRTDVVTVSNGAVQVYAHVAQRNAIAFGAGRHVGTVEGATRLFLDDTDKDGRVDISAVAPTKMSVFMNTTPRACGAGSTGPIDSIDGTLDHRVELADMNGDGKLDLVGVVNGDDVQMSRIGVAWGMGDGTFDTTPAGILDYQAPFDQSLLALHPADYDGDAATDLAFTMPSTDAITFLYGDPAQPGRFDRADLATDIDPYLIESADLDGDGARDLVIAGSDQVQIRSGNARGTRSFASPVILTTAVDVSDTECAKSCRLLLDDLDHDGKVDIVVWTATRLLVFRSMSQEPLRFAEPLKVPHDAGSALLTAANFLPDGRRSLLARLGKPQEAQQLVAYALDATSSVLEKAWESPVPTGSRSLATAAATDLDGDGRDEVFIDEGGLALLAPTPELAVRPLDPGFTGFFELALADVDGDGQPELVTAASGFGYTTTNTIQLSPDGQPDLGDRLSTHGRGADGPVEDLALGDFSGDGLLDVAVVDSPAQKIWLARQAFDHPGGLLAEVGALSASQYVVLGDLDGDLEADALTPGAAGSLAFLHVGSESPEPICSTQPDLGPAAVGDVTGDGRPDVVAATAGAVLLFDSPGFSCSTPRIVMSLDRPGFPTSPAVAISIVDMNVDGLLDLVVVSDAVRIALQDPEALGTFLVTDYEVTPGTGLYRPYYDARVADIDRDNLPDVVVIGKDFEVRTFINDLQIPGRLEPSAVVADSFRTGHSGEALALGDVQSDGLVDIVSFVSGRAHVFLQSPGPPLHFGFAYDVTGPGAGRTALVDFDQDGRADFVGIDRANGVMLWRGR